MFRFTVCIIDREGVRNKENLVGGLENGSVALYIFVFFPGFRCDKERVGWKAMNIRRIEDGEEII